MKGTINHNQTIASLDKIISNHNQTLAPSDKITTNHNQSMIHR